jgi:MoaA/NifB/PqqE/SkfB family radical SAM enzyme
MAARLAPPGHPGVRLTPKRLLNLWLARYQQAHGHTRLLGYPVDLAIEVTNLCNLRCPGCFTGLGEVGRSGAPLSTTLYQKLMDELGDYLFFVEFHNWGEPLLAKHIYDYIQIASGHGISTLVCTHFSLPFDTTRAERLVASGLAVLGVSLDGGTPESFARYRVGGDFETVLRNVRLVNAAKRRLGTETPRLVWSFHIFDHNRSEIRTARRMASELGMGFAASKGWVEGPDWDPEHRYEPAPVRPPRPCDFLWLRATINNDGGVAPCHGAFYGDDDFGHLGSPAVPLSALGTRSFHEVWNNATFRRARGMFRAPADGDDLLCARCPVTALWHRYRAHRATGAPASGFDAYFSQNEGFNYFLQRRAAHAPARRRAVRDAR